MCADKDSSVRWYRHAPRIRKLSTAISRTLTGQGSCLHVQQPYRQQRLLLFCSQHIGLLVGLYCNGILRGAHRPSLWMMACTQHRFKPTSLPLPEHPAAPRLKNLQKAASRLSWLRPHTERPTGSRDDEGCSGTRGGRGGCGGAW